MNENTSCHQRVYRKNSQALRPRSKTSNSTAKSIMLKLQCTISQVYFVFAKGNRLLSINEYKKKKISSEIETSFTTIEFLDLDRDLLFFLM